MTVSVFNDYLIWEKSPIWGKPPYDRPGLITAAAPRALAPFFLSIERMGCGCRRWPPYSVLFLLLPPCSVMTGARKENTARAPLQYILTSSTLIGPLSPMLDSFWNVHFNGEPSDYRTLENWFCVGKISQGLNSNKLIYKQNDLMRENCPILWFLVEKMIHMGKIF